MSASPKNDDAPDADGWTDERRFPYWRRNMNVLPLSVLLSSMGFAISWPFLPVMLRSLGVTHDLEAWIGFMMLVYYAISFVSNPLWGGIADHYGRKLMVLRAFLGMGTCMVLVAFAATPGWFAFLFMLVGLFNGAFPAAQALLVANTPPGHIGRGLSRLQTGMLVGHTLAPVIATTLAAMLDRLHWLFWVSGGLFLTAGILVAAFVREVKQLAPGPWRPQWISSLRELVAMPRVGPLFLLCFVFAALSTGNITIVSVYVLQLLEAQPEHAGSAAFWVGAVAIGLSLSSVVAMFAWGRLLDRTDPARVLTWATAAAALTQLPLIVLQTPLQLVLARVAFGFTASIMLPAIIRLLKSYAPPGMDARAIAYASSFQFIAMGIAPFCAGLIGPAFGLRTYFALTAVLTAAALVLWQRSLARAARPRRG